LVTVAIPHARSVVPTPKLLWSVRHFFTLSRASAAKKIRAGDMAHIDELVQRWSPGWDVPKEETEAVKRAFREPGCLEAALGYYRALSPKLPRSQRAKTTVPAVAFAGTNDLIAPSAYERARNCYTEKYEVVEMPGSHFMHRQYPEIFVKELSRVLEPYRAKS
jgi:pimeloyl-ACP methyl ester carboxylesterase